MKKLILLPLLAFISLITKAQDSTSLYQQFDLCDSVATAATAASGSGFAYDHFPPGWSAYSTVGNQDWNCEVHYGIGNSPCMHINGYTSGSNQEDSNWLITPKLNLSSYAGSIFINFAASSYYTPGDSIHLLVSTNYVAGTNPDSATWTDLPHYGVFAYDTFYYTHQFEEFQCDLTPYKATPIYAAFRYTSAFGPTGVGYAVEYDFDSVTTGTVSFGPVGTTSPLTDSFTVTTGLSNITNQKIAVSVYGVSTPDDVKVAVDATPGNYDLSIYDLVGRKVYTQAVIAQAGNQTFTINNGHFEPGMYVLKLSNENNSRVIKFGVQ